MSSNPPEKETPDAVEAPGESSDGKTLYQHSDTVIAPEQIPYGASRTRTAQSQASVRVDNRTWYFDGAYHANMYVQLRRLEGANCSATDLREPKPEPPPAPRGLPAGFVHLTLADADTPRRQWLIPGLAMFGQITLVIGRGGRGKSALVSHLVLAVATRKKCLLWEPEHRRRVLVVASEDDLDEQRRRCSAAAATLGISATDIAGQVITLAANDELTLITRDGDGKIDTTPLFQRIEKVLEQNDVGMVVIDPFVETSRGFQENSNDDVATVVSMLRALARQHSVALVLVHHGRKGAGTGDQDAARGASALVNMARFCLNLEGMSEKEAETYRVNHPEQHIRVDTSKSNYAKRSATNWLEIIPVDLENGESAPTFRVAELEPTEDTRNTWARNNVHRLLEVVSDAPKGGWKMKANGKRDTRLDCSIADRLQVEQAMATGAVEWLRSVGYVCKAPGTDARGRPTEVWLRTTMVPPESAF